jgi:hypothetical protein
MYKHDHRPVRPFRRVQNAGTAPSSRPLAADHGVPLAVVIVATLGLTVTSGCAVAPPAAPAVVPTCVLPAPSPSPSQPPPAPPPPVARVVAHPAYVRPVVPPLPSEVYQPSTAASALPKAVFYGPDLVAAMVQNVPVTDVFLAGGDTYFWHKDPHGHRERVFYGHGDRRGELTQRRDVVPAHAADSAKAKEDVKL